jgi:hypothetical protein
MMKQRRLRCLVGDFWAMSVACSDSSTQARTALSLIEYRRIAWTIPDVEILWEPWRYAFYVTAPMGIQGVRNGRNIMSVYALSRILPTSSFIGSMAQPVWKKGWATTVWQVCFSLFRPISWPLDYCLSGSFLPYRGCCSRCGFWLVHVLQLA